MVDMESKYIIFSVSSGQVQEVFFFSYSGNWEIAERDVSEDAVKTKKRELLTIVSTTDCVKMYWEDELFPWT